MSALKSNRGAQYPLVAEFTFDVSTAVNDTMPTTVGNAIAGAAPAYNAVGVAVGGVATNVFELFGMPTGSVVIGGELVVETAVVGPTVSTLSLGDATNAAKYLAATSLLAAARTPLILTGLRNLGENIRATIVNTVAVATAGKFTIRVHYVVAGRMQEVQVA